MARSSEDIAAEVSEAMRKSGKDVITMKWPAFYQFAARDRIKGAFMVSLQDALEQESIMVVEGHSVIAFVKDFDFSPWKK